MLLFDRALKIVVINSQQRLEIDELRASFKIKKDDKSSQNICESSIYNLNRVSRAQFEEKDAEFEVYAGYGGVARLIFHGNITWALHSQNGSDWVTKIQAHDGAKALRESVLFESFGPGTSLQTVLGKAADSLGIAVKELPSDFAASFTHGFSTASPTKAILDKLKKSFGFDWSIQDGELQVTKTNTATADTKVILNADTGMISSPEVLTADGENLDKDPQLRTGGVRVKSLLNHELRVGRLVEITSNTVNGEYKIVDVEHQGDIRGSAWYTIIKAEAL